MVPRKLKANTDLPSEKIVAKNPKMNKQVQELSLSVTRPSLEFLESQLMACKVREKGNQEGGSELLGFTLPFY